MGLWFVGSALLPELRERWSLDANAAGWLTAVVQLGFVAGTALSALLNLGDLVPGRALFAVSAVLAALANAALSIVPGYGAALVTRFLTGFFLAGVYPPAMKMMATWFKERRGLAIGTLVGALTLGKAGPYLYHTLDARPGRDIAPLASALALLGAIAVGAFYRDGPFPFARRPFHWTLAAEAVSERRTRLALGGYLGHMWELYAMWTWLPAFLTASFQRTSPGIAQALGDFYGFVAIASGALGCVWAGLVATRLGYARVVTWCMAISGACCVGAGFAFGHSPWLLVPLVCVWGFFVVADSAQFSALITEVAPPHAVGTALMLQTSLGFLLTMATIQLVPVLSQRLGWAWAFPILALGPAFGIASIARLGGKRG